MKSMKSSNRLNRENLHPGLSAHAEGESLVLRANELTSLLRSFRIICVTEMSGFSSGTV